MLEVLIGKKKKNTHCQGEIHKKLADHKAQDKAEADVDGVGGGPDPGVEHLRDHNPDQSAVPSITEKQQRHCKHGSSSLLCEAQTVAIFQKQLWIAVDSS